MAKENVSLIDSELRQKYVDFTDKFVVTEESLSALRSGGGMSKPPPIPDEIEVVNVEEGKVQGLIYRPKDPSKRIKTGVLWYHGGGYIFGRPGIHQLLYIRFVTALGVTVFAPQYRLAPEHAYPAAHEDAFDAWLWFRDVAASKYGLDANKLALGGTSAGGGLAFGVALRIRDEKRPAPACVVGNIPFFSATHGASLKSPVLQKCWGSHNCSMAQKWYTPEGLKDTKYAWVHEAKSFAGLPPASITVADLDTLRDAAVEVASRIMVESENSCELHVWRGAFHGSVALNPDAAVSKAQDEQLVGFVKRVVVSD